MGICPGVLVKTVAGHDKNNFFFIFKEEGEYVYLVDGKSRRCKKPKKKNKKHVKAVFCGESEPGKKLKESGAVTDEEIARLIKCFKREKQEEKTQAVRR